MSKLTRRDIDERTGHPEFHGWIPHELRTRDERDAHDAIVGAMPAFVIASQSADGVVADYEAQEAKLYKYSQQANGGRHFPTLNQKHRGSCIGHALANGEWLLQAIEAYTLGDLQTIVMPFEPYGYAQSRACAGIFGPKDGSTGSGAAAAAKKYGILDSRLAGLPPFTVTEREVDFGQQTDWLWGRSGAPKNWINEARKHVITTTAPIRSVDSARTALQNRYPIIIASKWGGQMPGEVTHGVVLLRRGKNWGHAWLLVGWRRHEILGDIYCGLNSWDPDAHGIPPDDSPPCSFWILERDLTIILNDDDSYAISGADGFPEASPNWMLAYNMAGQN